MKLVILIAAFAFMAVSSVAQATETSAASALVTGSKTYQSRVISDVRPETQDQSKTGVDPVSVEPAAGVEADGEMQEGRDAIRNLQDQMKLPRKN